MNFARSAVVESRAILEFGGEMSKLDGLDDCGPGD